MPYLIVLLVIIGLISAISKRRKAQTARKPSADAPRAAVPKREEIPPTFTEAEWKAYRAEKLREAIRAAGTAARGEAPEGPAPAQPVVQPIQPTPPEPPVRDPVVTEGETDAEHDAHMERILARERRQAAARESARQLRMDDLRRMRSAVVTREILDKPVSLRNEF